ncbi:hypothetical protein TD95_002782 [Thielaviopsis punctulata]|uniref:Uncharacterized protein n=1 Tax=Thielaviopsis punctulata TaxID=72032 RepID=A0A0F4ZG61_9PEZI|nr:hypothetical protein TD95_002782 [Thielaviopsis punctulata]
MVVSKINGRAYRLGPRVPLKFGEDGLPVASHVMVEPPSKVYARAETASGTSNYVEAICATDSSSSFCEKPYQTKNLKVPITLCVVLPLAAAAIACVWFWNKNRLRERAEDKLEAARDWDYGIDDPKKRKNKPSNLGPGEKGGMHRGQISMDMNLSSPYLLPPKLNGSRDSLSSLARSIDHEADPYRPITSYANDAASMYAPSSRNNRISMMPASPATAVTKDPFDVPPSPRSVAPPRSPRVPTPPAQDPFASPDDHDHTDNVTAPYPTANNAHLDIGLAEMPNVQPPAAAVVRGEQTANQSWDVSNANNNAGINMDMPDHAHHLAVELPNDSSMSNNNAPPQLSISVPDSYNSNGPHYNDSGLIAAAPYPEDENHGQPQYPQDNYDDDMRGRSTRRSIDLGGETGNGGLLYAPENAASNNRMSVGFRPLPPDEIMDTEDPEYRANRIRSFYKEYFEDYSKPNNAPAVPALPRQYQNNGEAYMDPNSKAFVMPYAQPVTRRAMTPPPSSGPRMRGPAPPRFRADSAASGQIRPGSSASARPPKRGPPPSALSTLPNPSKLGDSMAILGAMDFAPPESMADRVAGRCQSPTLEKIAYNPKLPVSTPLQSTFDELSVMPNPSQLRKSSTFNALDFAPPRRFKDADEMSDAGSVRSNRSGLSSAHTQALRSGAGRVSRLPGDTVFAAADASALKPSWDLRG